uniref:Optic atrophy 3 protein homolog n=1 Tax=Crassostrea virginica TaxID=6565 RepID=A0A8B8E1G7_CRAVI|nr:optic atrophy 3 protein homolog [Crassostrea virginica]
MPFPIIKLVYLFAKQVSKPLATRATSYMKEKPFLRKYLMIPLAQAYHRTESNLRLMLMYNQRGHKVTVKPLSEEAAISLATDMMNDIFIFSIAFLVLYQEYIRSSKSSAAEKMQRENEILSINNQLDDLVLVTARHDTQLREAERERYHLLTMVSDLRTWSSSCTKLISEKQDSHLREVFRQIKHLQTIQLTVHKNSKTEHINIAVEKEKMD